MSLCRPGPGGPLPAPVVACPRASGSASAGMSPFVHSGPSSCGSVSSPWRDTCHIGLDFKPTASAKAQLQSGARAQVLGVRTGVDFPGDTVQPVPGGCGLSSSAGLSPRWPGAPPLAEATCMWIGSQLPTLPSLALTGEERLLFERSQGGSHGSHGKTSGSRTDCVFFSAKIAYKGKGLANNRRCQPRPA